MRRRFKEPGDVEKAVSAVLNVRNISIVDTIGHSP